MGNFIDNVVTEKSIFAFCMCLHVFAILTLRTCWMGVLRFIRCTNVRRICTYNLLYMLSVPIESTIEITVTHFSISAALAPTVCAHAPACAQIDCMCGIGNSLRIECAPAHLRPMRHARAAACVTFFGSNVRD